MGMDDTTQDPNQRKQPGERELSPRLADDLFYQTLVSQRRRRALYYLLEENDSNIEELATVLSGWEATETETIQTPVDRERILLSLAHIHLPQLADTGLVEYDSQTGSVQLASLHPQVVDIIRQSVRAEQLDDV